MKHYIITRFASWIYEPGGMTKETLFSDEFLQKSFIKLQNALIPTLENQTNKNFTLIINIHDDISIEKISFLQQLYTTFDIKILRTKEISSFILKDSNKSECVILSRIDYDDFIRTDVVNLIHQCAVQTQSDYTGLGLYTGSTMWYQDKTTYVFPIQNYTKSNSGAFSCMISIIFHNYKIEQWLQHHLINNPIECNHTKMFVYIKEFINKYDNNSTYSTEFIKEDNINKPLYLWAGYGDNGTANKRKIQNENINWHLSDIKSNIKFDEYGIKL